MKFFKRPKKKPTTVGTETDEDEPVSSFVVLEDATYPNRPADSFSDEKYPTEGGSGTDGSDPAGNGNLMGARSDNSIFDGCYEPPAVTKVRTIVDEKPPAFASKATQSLPMIRPPVVAAPRTIPTRHGEKHGRNAPVSDLSIGDEEEEEENDDSDIEGQFSDRELVDAIVSDGELTDETDSQRSHSDHEQGSLGSHVKNYQATHPQQPESLIAPHMLQWQYAAEEGPLALRVCILLGAIGLIVTSIVSVIMYEYTFDVTDIIISCMVFIQALLICFLEGRFYCLNPQGFRARVRILIIKHISVLRNVWGRGILCILAGILHLAHWWVMTTISAAVMIIIGSAAVIIGMHSANKLDNLRSALEDDTFLRFEFDRFDTDKDGHLTLGDFATFLATIGLEFDDMYVINAFHSIDSNKRRKINYGQFSDWWYRCKFNSRRAQRKTRKTRR